MTTDAEPNADLLADPPTLQVRGPADLVRVVPYLLGFHPVRSLVLVGLAGTRVVVTARVDLDDVADPGQPGLLRDSVAAMSRGGARAFVGLVVDDDAAPKTPAQAGGRLRDRLPWWGVAHELAVVVEACGAELEDVVLVCRSRMWSYVCDGPTCCPPEGRLLSDDSRVAATATFAGLVALPDRQSVAALLEPLAAAERERLIPLLDRAEHDAVTRILAGQDGRDNRSVVRALFAACRAVDAPGGAPELPEPDLVRFAVALQRYAVRDSLWTAVDDGRLDARGLWRQLARRLPAPYDAPALFLFGWRTYRDGDGALAGMAAHRAIDSDPGYSAADLLLAALARGVDPRKLPRLRARTA